jgi:clan AA aspartic protease
MGRTYTEITLKNPADITLAKAGVIPGSKIRQATVRALVDTGADELVITEALFHKLGLETVDLKTTCYANCATETVKVTDTVNVYWKNRCAPCRAIVVPDSNEVLFGAFPMEVMDLMVHPQNREVIGAHGDKMVSYCVSVRNPDPPTMLVGEEA